MKHLRILIKNKLDDKKKGTNKRPENYKMNMIHLSSEISSLKEKIKQVDSDHDIKNIKKNSNKRFRRKNKKIRRV